MSSINVNHPHKVAYFSLELSRNASDAERTVTEARDAFSDRFDIELLHANVHGAELLAIPKGELELTVGEAWQQAWDFSSHGYDAAPIFGSLEEGRPDQYSDATNDYDWSLEVSRIAAVRSRLGLTGKGVTVGHPDTGYTRHHELFDGKVGGVMENEGFDWVGHDKEPLDERGSRFFGHGTSTASVIMSDGVPHPADHNIFGAAPGVRLLPYRVTRSVVLASRRSRLNLAESNNTAVEQRADIISISLGWAWGLKELREAINNAHAHGVIVVAAAGQIARWAPPPPVAAPAKYSTVIAAAASDPYGAGMSWSARGSSVDITAPGEGVWRAYWEGNLPEIERSWGTSYAAAHVTGAAALWLQHFKKHPRIKADDGRHRATLFRHALYMCGLRAPNDVRDPSDWGAGLLDAEALLALDPSFLPDSDDSWTATTEWDELAIAVADAFGAQEARESLSGPLRDVLKGRFQIRDEEVFLQTHGPEMAEHLHFDADARSRIAAALLAQELTPGVHHMFKDDALERVLKNRHLTLDTLDKALRRGRLPVKVVERATADGVLAQDIVGEAVDRGVLPKSVLARARRKSGQLPPQRAWELFPRGSSALLAAGKRR